MFSPQYERVVVTGAGSGIGRAVALALAEAGCTVFALGRTHSKIEATARALPSGAGRLTPVSCDVRNQAQVEATFDAVERDGGPAQALYHAAADSYRALLEHITLEGFKSVLESRAVGSFNMLQRWARPLLARGLPGAAVLVTSALGSREAPGMAHSSLACAGVNSLMRAAAREWGRFNLRVNVIAPGAFPTAAIEEISASAVGQRMLRAAALGRFGDLEEIVGPSVFLLSRAASYVTGEILAVDGGLKLQPWTLLEPGDPGYSQEIAERQ
ncbi:MAG: SDR family oxidoreductase [Steroidobacteraceae bacterium]